MAKFTTAQCAWSERVLNHLGSGRASQNPAHPMEVIQAKESAYGLLDQLKARVILGEELSPVDLFNAKDTLSKAEQDELDALFEEHVYGPQREGEEQRRKEQRRAQYESLKAEFD